MLCGLRKCCRCERVSATGQLREPSRVCFRQLWSADRTERQNAKAELRDGGVEAIGPLVSLLEEFVFTPGSTFGDRKEKLFRRYLDYRRNPTSGIDREEGPGSMGEMSAVAVRVKQDVID